MPLPPLLSHSPHATLFFLWSLSDLVDIDFTLVLSVVGVGALLAVIIKVGELHSAHKVVALPP